ncbi:hypothetical protein OY671_013151, partial [Metschnikowia pulcherrima]
SWRHGPPARIALAAVIGLAAAIWSVERVAGLVIPAAASFETAIPWSFASISSVSASVSSRTVRFGDREAPMDANGHGSALSQGADAVLGSPSRSSTGTSSFVATVFCISPMGYVRAG